MKDALDPILQAEMTDFHGAGPGERIAARAGYRAGHRERGLVTRVGKIELRAPRNRKLPRKAGTPTIGPPVRGSVRYDSSSRSHAGPERRTSSGRRRR